VRRSVHAGMLSSAAPVPVRTATARTGSSAAGTPFDSLDELDSVSYVGRSALEKLRVYAAAHP
jgi:type II secretory pathway component PulK